MRFRILIVTMAVVGATLLVSAQAKAQGFRVGPSTSARSFIGPGGPVTLTPGTALPSATYATTYGSGYNGAVSGYTPPYSYYAAIPPAPARMYVDYANSGFNFYGRPYGQPNTRWSWSALSSDQNLLNRYYYQPLR